MNTKLQTHIHGIKKKKTKISSCAICQLPTCCRGDKKRLNIGNFAQWKSWAFCSPNARDATNAANVQNKSTQDGIQRKRVKLLTATNLFKAFLLASTRSGICCHSGNRDVYCLDSQKLLDAYTPFNLYIPSTCQFIRK